MKKATHWGRWYIAVLTFAPTYITDDCCGMPCEEEVALVTEVGDAHHPENVVLYAASPSFKETAGKHNLKNNTSVSRTEHQSLMH